MTTASIIAFICLSILAFGVLYMMVRGATKCLHWFTAIMSGDDPDDYSH